ncbi:MAG: hypothetical protein K9I35_07310 [Flavobacterium sp.]|jgi:hypothetical protein|nr:hypothetical protein [Flavobacterium sp.]
MSKINEMNLLLIKRDLLLKQQKADLQALKLQFIETRKVMSPLNILKSTFSGADLKSNLITITLGLASNYLIEKFPSFSIDTKIQKIAKRLFKFIK